MSTSFLVQQLLDNPQRMYLANTCTLLLFRMKEIPVLIICKRLLKHEEK